MRSRARISGARAAIASHHRSIASPTSASCHRRPAAWRPFLRSARFRSGVRRCAQHGGTRAVLPRRHELLRARASHRSRRGRMRRGSIRRSSAHSRSRRLRSPRASRCSCRPGRQGSSARGTSPHEEPPPQSAQATQAAALQITLSRPHVLPTPQHNQSQAPPEDRNSPHLRSSRASGVDEGPAVLRLRPHTLRHGARGP